MRSSVPSPWVIPWTELKMPLDFSYMDSITTSGYYTTQYICKSLEGNDFYLLSLLDKFPGFHRFVAVKVSCMEARQFENEDLDFDYFLQKSTTCFLHDVAEDYHHFAFGSMEVATEDLGIKILDMLNWFSPDSQTLVQV